MGQALSPANRFLPSFSASAALRTPHLHHALHLAYPHRLEQLQTFPNYRGQVQRNGVPGFRVRGEVLAQCLAGKRDHFGFERRRGRQREPVRRNQGGPAWEASAASGPARSHRYTRPDLRGGTVPIHSAGGCVCPAPERGLRPRRPGHSTGRRLPWRWTFQFTSVDMVLLCSSAAFGARM